MKSRIFREEPSNYSDFAKSYLDESGDPIPEVEVLKLEIAINSLGCKGDELTPNVPIIACIGDSLTFGNGPHSWVKLAKVHGHQFLNAGVECYNMNSMRRRYFNLRERAQLAGVVVLAGWHNLFYNEHNEEFWTSFFDEMVGQDFSALCTLPTSLTEECRTRGVDSFLYSPHTSSEYMYRGRFAFWGQLPYTLENLNMVLDNILRYNDCVRTYCARHQRILIDFYSLLLPKQYEDVPKLFWDGAHPRPEAHPIMADHVSEIIGNFLEARRADIANSATLRF